MKSSNILLDKEFEAHLTDFGISMSLCTTKSHTSTYIMGTIGNIDPEYARTSRLTEKSDVYSYGIFLLELLTGRKAVDNESNLHHLILSKTASDSVMETVDPDVTATGIGLSISKCLVGLMNGEIGFVSIPQVGSTFTFTAVSNDACSTSKECKGQQVKGQGDSGTSEFHGMKAVVVDRRPVRANVSKYHIQRLGIHVEVVADLNQCLHTIQSGNCRIDMVLLEWEIWDKDSRLSAIFLDKLRDMKPQVSPQLFLLSNSISSSRMSGATTDATGPFMIMKPLRASMLVASLQRVMGVGNQISCSNGESLSLSLRNLLCGRKILVMDDNKVNLRVAEGALKKYGADVVCTDSGEKAIALLRPPHDFDACFMDIQMPGMDGFELQKEFDRWNKVRARNSYRDSHPQSHVKISRISTYRSWP